METYSHKSIQLISMLSSGECHQFEAFLESGMYSTDPRMLLLFQSLVASVRMSSPVNFESCFRQIEPKLTYTDQRMRDQLRRLTSLIHTFLAINALLKDQETLDFMTLQALANRDSPLLFSKQYNTARKRESTRQQDSLSHLEFTYRTLRLRRLSEESSSHRIYSRTLKEESETADRMFILTKLRQYCETLNRNYIYQQEDKPDLIEEIVGLIDRHPKYLEDAGIRLWKLALHTLLTPTSRHALDDLLESLNLHAPNMEKDECRSLYKYALNFCIRRINAGESDYLGISFQIYQQMLAEGLMHSQGWLSHTDVKNIVSSGIRVGKVEWVMNFIEEARDQVKSPWAENVYTYCKSYILAETGRKREAIRLLQELTFSDVYYAVSARILLLRTFFEMGEFETLLYQITAFENFLKRNRSISPRNKKLHLSFAGQLRKVTKLKEIEEVYPENDVKQKYEKLERQVSQKELSNKSWLLNQILSGASGQTSDT